ncbi:ABC transporter substrate-binding protein [Bradyrhizobium prioriisuperbiae]|uniref:ABC transporter substrate-binding protein n=1 Tax=Bradyrhizobium prioriisuperbiae TaxID=2854389 RepID=UPI0028ECAE77|nr:ABC transporter substrate-binding protein [Bradyrhizobium prioritasuperba]
MANSLTRFGLIIALAVSSGSAWSAEKVNLVLNWTPTADHSPFYYAKAQGWYEKAGIDLTIEVGKGSGASSLKVGSGGSEFGIADLATMLVARGKGADVVALMSIYANTAQTFYWLKSYGINGPKDFPNHKIGNPPADAARVMWPAFAKAVGIGADSVSFVNIGPTAKIAALKSHTVDVITDFYNEHDLKVKEFGDDLGFVNWKDIGLNPYGNSLVVNGQFLQKNPKIAEDFVKITQRAFATCVADVEPCLKVLLEQASGLDRANQVNQWERIKFMMTDQYTPTKALGWIDPDRMKSDYELVQTYLGMEKPFAVETAFTTRLLDTSVKMDASKVKR